MPDFIVCSSNRLENLADRLAEIVRRPLSTAIEPETVIVQSRGMARWVSLALARRNGICANVWYPFPNAFIDSLFRRTLPDVPVDSPFDRDLLTFRVLKSLPIVLDRPLFSPLRRYLTDDDRGLKAYQLSARLADLFDQYLVFRPEMILQWEAGEGEDAADSAWQAELWRILTQGREKHHRAYLQKKFLERLQTPAAEGGIWPSRVSIFGISYLPPFHLQVFVGLSQIVPVHFFLLSPCREYWADILSPGEMNRLVGKSGSMGDGGDGLHMELGHPLLASMGQMGREFFQAINQHDAPMEDRFEPISGTGLLARLQSDILDLKDRSESRFRPEDQTDTDGTDTNRSNTASRGADGSIQIHSCHGPMREIEVLRDRLLDFFEEDPALKPKDVIVMTPDIGAYAPFITAVFDTPGEDEPLVPYAIADRSVDRVSPVVRSFLKLLDLPDSRFAASWVIDLLGSTGVKERFRLTSPEVDTVARWVSDVNIRWGRDADQRKQKGLPGNSENTWQAGIDRFLLGYAMPGHDRVMFSGILPYDHIEGGEAQVLGRFLAFLDRLFDWSARLARRHSPVGWQSVLTEMIDAFIAVDENTDREAQFLQGCLESFGRLERGAEFNEPLGLETVRAYVESRIEGHHGEGGFLAGGVTFCAMLPMRSIPFKVVCLVGMNADVFPRENHPLGCDLIARLPRAGDRSRRKDDKYLFLEALVSARCKFYISYVGQNAQDNTPIPPSVLVSELIECLTKGFGVTENDLVLRHPLQAYSRRYFDESDPSLFSYSGENFLAAAAAGESNAPEPFFTRPLSEPSHELRTLHPQDLGRFYSHPVRYLLSRRLKLHLDDPVQHLEDKENFDLDTLGRYQLNQDMLNLRLSGQDLSDYFQIERAKGDLPLGTVGRVVYRQMEQGVERFAEELKKLTGNEPAQSLPIDMDLEGFHLLGSLSGIYRSGRVQVRFARRKAKDWLSVWIGHLVLCALEDNRCPAVSILFDVDGMVRLESVDRPKIILKELLEIYLEGLRRPLHFFPELSFNFVEMVTGRGISPAEALQKVRKQWIGSDFKKGGSEDPYHRLCFGSRDVIDDDFRSLAERVFTPIRRHADPLGLGPA